MYMLLDIYVVYIYIVVVIIYVFDPENSLLKCHLILNYIIKL